MFGKTIDYHLLRPLAHDRNRATEAELDARARATSYGLDEARAHLAKMQDVYFEGRVPIDPRLRYLDIGCGMGRLSLALSLAGAHDVTGIDIVPRHVDEARAIAARTAIEPSPRFLVADIHDWQPDRRYDVVFVMGAMEHIHDPAAFLAVLPRLLAPDGRAFVSIEPFHSPIGDHMSEFFRVQIPWRGLLFSEQAILRLRLEHFRPTDPATRYEEIAGGLNQIPFRRYLRAVDAAGLEFAFHNFNPQLKHHRRYRALYPASRLLTSVPGLRDFFIVCAYGILRHKRVLANPA